MLKKKRANKLILKILLFCIFFTVPFYIYFLFSAVSNAAERNKNQAILKEINKEIQNLEENYLLSIKKIDSEYAKTLGFSEQKNKIEYLIKPETVVKR